MEQPFAVYRYHSVRLQLSTMHQDHFTTCSHSHRQQFFLDNSVQRAKLKLTPCFKLSKRHMLFNVSLYAIVSQSI